MNITSEINGNTLLLAFEGDLLGEQSGAEIVGVVVEKIEDNIKSCAIDLSNVRYMNSSGIGVMITIMTKFKNIGGETLLVNPSSQIMKLLVVTKLDAVFTIVESQEEALAKLNG